MDYYRGSEWRRWDLHIHTPETKKQDNYEGTSTSEKWNHFYETIEAYVGDGTDPLKNVAVLGITDYVSIDNYKKVLNDKRLPSTIELLIPNVEMRVIPIAKDTAINIHFLFNPEIIDDIETRFFAKLSIKHGSTEFSAAKPELIRLGRLNDPTLKESDAYIKGIGQFVPSFDNIQKVFTDDADLRSNTLIFVSNSSSDGVSGAANHSCYLDPVEGNSQLTTTRLSIYKFVDGIFSATPSDRDYFLGKKSNCPAETVIRQCGGLKPCIHGSDAHSLSQIFEPDEQRYCWIKADPTFNGLKQIIYEPEERVCISHTKPQVRALYQLIDSLTINHDDFQVEPIIFSDKLNCIIGGKSTGKTILLHNLARAIAPIQVAEKCGFRARNEKTDKSANPITLEIPKESLAVKWADGDTSSERAIVYIPQTYLNRLTDSKQETTEIDEIIESVLLGRTDSSGKLLSETKEELITLIDNIKSDNTNSILEIIRIHNRIRNLSSEVAELGGKRAVEQELKRLKDARELISKELNIQQEDIEKFDDACSERELQGQRSIQLTKEIVGLNEITAVILPYQIPEIFSEETRSVISELITKVVKKANESWNVQKEDIIEQLNEKLTESSELLNRSTTTYEQLKPKIESNNQVKELVAKITKEEDKLKLIEEKERRILTESEVLDRLIIKVSNAYYNLSLAYQDFANTIANNVNDDSSGLRYAVQIPFKENEFISKWSTVYHSNNLKNKDTVNVDNFDKSKYSAELLEAIITRTLNGELRTRKGYEDHEHALRNILNDWYNIKYIVEMDNDSIDVMSPGKKALVLLQLLIDLDDSNCPILIDQPEDDLDNRSIFEELIPFIKRKKKDRQIILVTHNANIVLGADAEEVIVANQHGVDSEMESKRFEYRTGAIENDYSLRKVGAAEIKGVLNKQGIQQHICDILEGGIKAFEKRKNKYQL